MGQHGAAGDCAGNGLAAAELMPCHVMLLASPQAHFSPEGGSGMAGLSPASAVPSSLRKRSKLDVCDAFLARLREKGSLELDDFAFIEGVQQHFRSLPSRYALDVGPRRSRLPALTQGASIGRAASPESWGCRCRSTSTAWTSSTTAPAGLCSGGPLRPVLPGPARGRHLRGGGQPALLPQALLHRLRRAPDGGGRAQPCRPACGPSLRALTAARHVQALAAAGRSAQRAGLSRPAFGSSPNLQVGGPRPGLERAALQFACAWADPPRVQAMLNEVEDWQDKIPPDPAVSSELNFFEVTIASVDQPKLLSRLSEALVGASPAAAPARLGPSPPTLCCPAG